MTTRDGGGPPDPRLLLGLAIVALLAGVAAVIVVAILAQSVLG